MRKYITVKIFFMAAGLLMSVALHANEVVYLSPAGSDENGAGTLEAPFFSLNKAVEGRLDGKGETDTLFIQVAAGDYYLDRTFVIDRPSSRPVVIRAANPSDKPRFMGAVRVKGWQKYGDKLYRAYVPEVKRYGLNFEQFYVNGKRAVLARTPNSDWLHVKSSSETPWSSGLRCADYATQRIVFAPDDWKGMEKFSADDLAHIKFRFYHKWDITHKRAAHIDTDSALIYIHGKGMQPWNMIDSTSRYLMYDYMAALDAPGEWFLDRKDGYLYYMPLPGEDMAAAECMVSALNRWVSFKGEADRPVKNITLENLAFLYSAYRMPDMGEEPAQAAAYVEAAMEFSFAENISLVNCDILHTGAYAVWFGQECHGNRVERCYMADLGAGGIKVGEPFYRSDNRPVTSRNVIHNNIITHVGRELPCGIGVVIFHSSDNEVTHNDISDLYYSGISVGWVWGYNAPNVSATNRLNEKGAPDFYMDRLKSPAVRNLVAYNHIHHIGWGELSDMGAVYTLGESYGTKVIHNVVHDVLSYDYGGWGLYTDEGSTGVEMSNNLVYRCKSGGFHQHYGKDNKIENNIFAFGHYQQLDYTRAEDHLSFHFKHNIILQDSGEIMKGVWDRGKVDMDHNLYWSSAGDASWMGSTFSEWKKSKEPHAVYADPMFRNPRADDYRFLSLKAVRKIGFKLFDYSLAGVYGDKAWTDKARLSAQTIADFNQRCLKILNK